MKQAGQPSKFSVSLEQQQLSPLRLRVSLLVVAIVTLGLATHDNSGLISRISLIWLTISIASSIVLLHFWYAPLQHVAGFRREWLLALLAAGLTLQFIALISYPLGRGVGTMTDTALISWILPSIFILALLLAGLLIYRNDSPGGWKFPMLVIMQLTAGFILITAFPNLPIDVFIVQEKAANALIHGINPYTIHCPDIYPPELSARFYGPGATLNGMVQAGYLYMPLTLFMSLLGSLLGDCRYASLIAMAISASLIAYARPGRFSKIAAAFLLFTPVFPLMLYCAWTDSYVVLMLTVVWFCYCRSKRCLPYAVGLLFVSKQYMVLITPLALLLINRPWRLRDIVAFSWRVIVAGAIVTLPLALWNIQEFMNSAVLFHFHQPFRWDSMSFLALARSENLAQWVWLPFAIAITTMIAIVWIDQRHRVNFFFAIGITLILFFAFNKQAFANYYYVVIGSFCCALAAESEDGLISVHSSDIYNQM
jgi:hypothetical protein